MNVACEQRKEGIVGKGFSSLLVFVALNALVLSAVPSIAKGEIQKEMYQEMNRNAPELLHLRIDKVSEVHSTPDKTYYAIEATVDKVERSASDYRRGDKIEFDSYYVDPKAWSRGFVGPKSPPKLYPGWTGWIFLSKDFTANLSPAAYGHSFHYSFFRSPIAIDKKARESRQKSQVNGGVRIINNYGDAEFVIRVYSGGRSGHVFSAYEVRGAEKILERDGVARKVSGDAGIDIVFGNGVTGSRKVVSDIGRFRDGEWRIVASDLFAK